MYKKSRITALKHRITRKKQHERRLLARRLIKGDIRVDQLERLAGSASNGVLRMVNYLSETEGTTLSTDLSQAVAQAVAPASTSGTALLQRRVAAVAPPAPRRTRAPAEPEPVAEEPVAEAPTETAEAASVSAEEAPVEEAAPATPARRKTTRAATKAEKAPKDKPKK